MRDRALDFPRPEKKATSSDLRRKREIPRTLNTPGPVSERQAEGYPARGGVIEGFEFLFGRCGVTVKEEVMVRGRRDP